MELLSRLTHVWRSSQDLDKSSKSLIRLYQLYFSQIKLLKFSILTRVNLHKELKSLPLNFGWICNQALKRVLIFSNVSKKRRILKFSEEKFPG